MTFYGKFWIRLIKKALLVFAGLSRWRCEANISAMLSNVLSPHIRLWQENGDAKANSIWNWNKLFILKSISYIVLGEKIFLKNHRKSKSHHCCHFKTSELSYLSSRANLMFNLEGAIDPHFNQTAPCYSKSGPSLTLFEWRNIRQYSIFVWNQMKMTPLKLPRLFTACALIRLFMVFLFQSQL